jgi:hypothetical protein
MTMITMMIVTMQEKNDDGIDDLDDENDNDDDGDNDDDNTDDDDNDDDNIDHDDDDDGDDDNGRLMSTPLPHNPQVGRSVCSQDLFFLLARRTPNGSSISLSGNLHPQKSSWDPLFTNRGIRIRDFVNPKVGRRSLESPKPDNQSTLTFSYRDFATYDIKHLASPNPEPRYAETPIYFVSLTFQRFSSSTFRSSQYRKSKCNCFGTSRHESPK